MRAHLVLLAVVFSVAPALAQTGVWMDGRGNFSSRIDGRGVPPQTPRYSDEVQVRRYLPPRGDGFTFQDSFGNGMSIRNNYRPACREVVYPNAAGGITREFSCDQP